MVQETARINFEATNLDVVEGRIKAIGGAINVLGGSIEVVVGSMGLIGIDEKVTKQFQDAATSAIAFADGAKRVFEGYKELREAAELFKKAQAASTVVTVANTTATAANNAVQASSVGVLAKARAAWAAFTAALARNPITIVAVAIAALVGGLILLTDQQDETAESAENLAGNLDLVGDALERQQIINEGILLDAKLRGANERQILTLKLQQLNADRETIKNEENRLGRSKLILENRKLIEGSQFKEQALLDSISVKYDEYTNKVLSNANAIKQTQLEINAYNKGQASAIRDKIKKDKEDALQAAEDILKKSLEFQQELDGKIAELTEKTRQRELDDLRDYLIGKQLELEMAGQDSAERLEKLNEFARLKSAEINKRWDVIDADALEKAEEEKKQIRDAANNEFLIQSFRTQADEVANAAKNDDQRILKLREFFEEKRELYKNDENALEQLAKVEKSYYIDSKTRQEQIVEDLEELSKKVNAIAGLASTAIDSMSQIQESNQEKRLNEIEAYYQNMAQNVVGSEAEVADQLARIEAEKNDKMEKLKEDFFENQKKYRIAEVTITGLQGAFAAFVQASSTIPPPAGQIVGGVLAGLVLTAMAAQISQIKKQKYIRGTVSGGAGGAPGAIGGRGGGTNLGNLAGGNFLQPIPNPGDPGNRTGASQNNFGFMSAPNTSPNTPIRAYVVASDVETGLEAERSLNARRRL